MRDSPMKSTASIVAIVAAIVSFAMSYNGREFLALMLAVLGIVSGVVGWAMSFSSRVSGGILSLAAVVLSGLAVVVAVIALLV